MSSSSLALSPLTFSPLPLPSFFLALVSSSSSELKSQVLIKALNSQRSTANNTIKAERVCASALLGQREGVCVYVCALMCEYAHMHVCTYGCVFVQTCVCVCVCVYVHVTLLSNKK